MKKILTASFLLLIMLSGTRTFAQHPVIFETFQENLDLCPAPSDFQSQMTSAVGSPNYSKVLHLNHHVPYGGYDPIAEDCTYSGQVGNSLEPAPPGSQYAFFGAVNRLNPEFGIVINGSQLAENNSWVSDMDAQINAGYANPPPDSISLASATLDKSTNGYTFRATVAVTATSNITDSLIIRYVILEDKVSGAICSSTVTQNDCVRDITTGDSVVFLAGTSSGTTNNVSYKQTDLLRGNFGQPGALNPVNMRFLVFLEEPGVGIIDAKQLIVDLDTLAAPPPTLTLNSTNLDDSTFTPGAPITVKYSATNLPNGIDLYYSSNGGTTWSQELTGQNSFFNTINWNAPDTLTTEGKIKLVGTGVPSLVSTETGTFSIVKAATIQFDSPLAGAVLHADSLVNFSWSQSGITSDTLKYALRDQSGGYPKFVPITVTSDTFFTWKTLDTTDAITFQLVPVNREAPAFQMIDTIKQLTQIKNGVALGNSFPAALSVVSIYPNPASNGQEMVIAYDDASSMPVSLEVSDLLGHAVPAQYSVETGTVHLQTNGLQSGVYILRLSDGLHTISKQVEVVK